MAESNKTKLPPSGELPEGILENVVGGVALPLALRPTIDDLLANNNNWTTLIQGRPDFVGHNGSALIAQGGGNIIANNAAGIIASSGGT